MFCEELTELILISINNIVNFSNDEILINVKNICNMKVNDSISLSNKIIIKHKNLLDKII